MDIKSENIKDNDVFKRLLILQITPFVFGNNRTYFHAAQMALEYANAIIKELDKNK